MCNDPGFYFFLLDDHGGVPGLPGGISMSEPPAVLLFLAVVALMFFIALLLATKSFSAIWSAHCVLKPISGRHTSLNPASCRMELVLCDQTSAGRVEIPLLNVVLRYTQRPTMGECTGHSAFCSLDNVRSSPNIVLLKRSH